MSKRLQVVLGDAEMRRYEESAEALGLSLSAWVRLALRAAEQEVAGGDVDHKLAAIRAAFDRSFPAPDIDAMLAEIEQGYLDPKAR
jgi:hypothetical protein